MKKMKLSVCSAIVLLTACLFLACFSAMGPENGGMGTISIGGLNKSLITQTEGLTFTHELTFTGPGGTIVKTLPPGQLSTTVQVTPGRWKVTVRATNAGVIKAYSSTTVTVRGGENSPANIKMSAATDDWGTLGTLINAAVTAGVEEIIYIAGPITAATIITKSNNGTVRLLAIDGEKQITKSGNISLFKVESGLLILGEDGESNSLVLKGNADGGSLLYINGGSAQISGNTVLKDNTATSFGGAVYVDPTGIFTMTGGTISGNTATSEGGGVYIGGAPLSYIGGEFIMTGGNIYDNHAATYGGGVLVNTEYSIFTMSGGTISNNTAVTGGGGVSLNDNSTFNMSGSALISDNEAGFGGGVCNYDSKFTMSGGTISGNTATGTNGGGVWGNSMGLFIKNGGGIIYGDTDTTHTPGSTENTAASGVGHAVYTENSFKSRNTTAGTAVNMDSSDGINASDPWI